MSIYRKVYGPPVMELINFDCSVLSSFIIFFTTIVLKDLSFCVVFEESASLYLTLILGLTFLFVKVR